MGFKQLLDSLRLSSKEAIVDGEKDSLNDQKKYLHIERPVEQDLSQLITAAAVTDEPALILLLGNVGDGKSHLLARMWEQHPEQLSRFKVTNDATESDHKHKTYLDNLAEVFSPYRDEALKDPNNRVKTIIAINLGTLANFLSECEEGFEQLKQYVKDHRLVEEKHQPGALSPHHYFRALNLTDYHNYSLSANGAQSAVLLDIIRKITAPVDGNKFYEGFKETYRDHPFPAACPIKYNYELLAKPEVQATLNTLLVKSILTDKLIVSVRLLMNLVYDLIVPPDLSVLTDQEIRTKVLQPAYKKDFYTATLPVLLFESSTTSAIFRSFQRQDPVSFDNESLDEVIVKLSTAIQPGQYFERFKLLAVNDPLYTMLPELSIRQRVELFLRLCFIHNQLGLNQDPIFKSFVDDLYYFNVDQRRNLQPLYRKVSYAIYQWNGTTKLEGNAINLDIGRKQSAYKISRNMILEFSPVSVPAAAPGLLNRFFDSLEVGFKIQNHPDRLFTLSIDYLLYQLIDRINKGYRPNRIDKDTHVRFSRFVNELIRYQSATQELTILEYNGETKKKFTLSYTAGFDTFQFTEV